MAEHYWSEQPRAPHRRREIEEILRDRHYRFITDTGVFSGRRVDPGSRLLIKTMVIDDGETVLDLGCGYGAIGIAAAALTPHGQVYLVDPNQRAVDLAKENLELNRIENADVRVGEGCQPVAEITFDVILSNPPIRAGKRVLFQMMDQAHACLREAGRFYLVAKTKQGVKTLAAKMAEKFARVEEVAKGGGYRVILARK